ncbi:hypothetical protein FQA47_022012 [Oryzias melastigma]|uniref:Uncharacterized protein n=1 Tax=Oryzias melastigma TaxID=30732 RepID=A0A834FQB5_ORYME|nr:hypothetical protein FQA47_022012 [Oryzias melastigma]
MADPSFLSSHQNTVCFYSKRAARPLTHAQITAKFGPTLSPRTAELCPPQEGAPPNPSGTASVVSLGRERNREFRRVHSPVTSCDEQRNQQRRGGTPRREELSSGPVSGTTQVRRIHAEPSLPSTCPCTCLHLRLWVGGGRRLFLARTDEDFRTFSDEEQL